MSLVKSFLKLNTKWKLNQSSTSTILLLLNHAQHIQIKLNIIRATLKDMCNGLQHTTTTITTRLRDRQVRRQERRKTNKGREGWWETHWRETMDFYTILRLAESLLAFSRDSKSTNAANAPITLHSNTYKLNHPQ
jgi:hypothetical protein